MTLLSEYSYGYCQYELLHFIKMRNASRAFGFLTRNSSLAERCISYIYKG